MSITGFILQEMTDQVFHVHMARACQREEPFNRVVSAGFAYIENGKVTCSGRSESLNINSLPEDSALLQTRLFG
jgi:hypothetical protein